MKPRPRPKRRGAALITAVILLLVMATISLAMLGMRTTDVATYANATARLRADAAALGALQLAARQLAADPDLQAAAAMVIDHEGDTWTADTDPLFAFDGALGAATFTVEVWPRPDAFRLRARGVCAGHHAERWARLPLTRAAAEEMGGP